MKGTMKKNLLLFYTIKSMVLSWNTRFQAYVRKELTYWPALKKELIVISRDPRFRGGFYGILLFFFIVF
jgi:hypothetical protein